MRQSDEDDQQSVVLADRDGLQSRMGDSNSGASVKLESLGWVLDDCSDGIQMPLPRHARSHEVHHFERSFDCRKIHDT